MRFGCVAFFVVIFSCFSCSFFSKEHKNHKIDTVIDYSKVDISPTFKNCKELSIAAKTTCFRKEINKRIQASLVEYNFITEEVIDETILIDLLIDNKGKFKLKKIIASNKIKNQLPKLDSVLRSSIHKLPKITPAFKRGIPVVTQYQLPIKIAVRKEAS